ncbi:MAG: fibronectin type III domain-containing protein, partial [Clostridiales bacterium]|nr:fibronectin type III domain-containing protein [Clostridiales bacterium]
RPATETTFTITGLEHNTTYTYGMTAYKEASSSARIKGESVLSQEIVFTTLPEGDISVEITSPNDTTVSVGDSAVFNASIIVDSDDYIATNYQWQEMDSSGAWENLSNDSSTVSGATSSKLTLSKVTKEEDGNEYRCILKVSYEGIDSIISYYSNPAELHVDSVDIDLDFTVTGSYSGSGTLENPYTGLSNTSTVSSTDDGTTLTLTAVATKKNGTGAKDAAVDFKIYNLEDKTTNTITVVADSSGKATTTWTAPKAASYGLRAVVRSDDVYDQTLSDMCYYEASKVYDEDTTEYRLRLQQDGSAVSNIDYGESVSLVLQSRTVKAGSTDTSGSWSNVSGTVVFTVADNDTETTIYTGQNGSNASYEPDGAGAVTFNAYLGSTDGDVIATKSMQVNKVDITITPTWEEDTIPTSEDDVTLSVDEGLVDMTATEADAFLKESILDISCSYFDLDEQENAYGKYTISLSYKNYEDKDSTGYLELTTFKNNYNVTLESDSFTLKKESAVVTYSSSENGKLRGYYTDNRYNLSTGSSVTKGTALYFTATPSDGYAVDSREINGTTYTSSSTLPDGMEWSSNGKQLAIESFDTTNHVGADGTLNVVVHFAVEVESSYGEEESEGTTGTETELESESTTTTKTSFQAKGSAKKTSVKLSWSKVSGADGYIIYGKKVGSGSKMKLLTVIKSGSKTTWTHQSLKKATTYKYRIKAYKLVNGKKQIIGISNTMKLATTGGKYTNVSRLRAVTKVTVKLGKTKKLSVKTVLAEKSKSLSKHTKSLTYTTSDSSVVKVTSSGKLKAVGRGTCKVYITSASGAYAMVRVTVK